LVNGIKFIFDDKSKITLSYLTYVEADSLISGLLESEFVSVPLSSFHYICLVIFNIKMKCVCVCVRQPAAGPTQAITPKFGMSSSFHPGSAPSQGATLNVDPKGYPLE
jgi:hypothetical protein